MPINSAAHGVPLLAADVEEVIAVSLREIAGEFSCQFADDEARAGQKLVGRLKHLRLMLFEPQQFRRDVRRIDRIGAQFDQLIGFRQILQPSGFFLRAAIEPDHRGR